MSKQVIILAEANAPPAIELTESLTSGGVSFLVYELNELSGTSAPIDQDEPVLLHEVRPADGLEALRAVVAMACTKWPGAPILACRRTSKPFAPGSRLSNETLKNLGFRAVADNPAQLPALLRQVEDNSTGELKLPRNFENAISGGSFPSAPRALSGERLRKSFTLVAALHLASDQKEAGRVALAGISALVPADRWTIFLAAETGGTLHTFTPLVSFSTDGNARLPFDGEWQLELFDETSWAVEPKSNAAQEAATKVEAIRKRDHQRRVLAMPLVNGDRVIGVLEAVRDRNAARMFSRRDVALLEPLSLPISAALTNSLRIADAERLSLTDDLTKLNNARYLRQFLVNEIKRARRYHSKVTAVFLDLDDFKRVNDMHGHLAGSHALMEMASVILPSVRDTDCVVRYGGDEFVVILPETGADEACRVADRVRSKIEHHHFTGGRQLDFTLSASFGIAVFPDHALSPQQLVACADTAMYEAKAAGKNCIRVMSVEATSERPDRNETLAVPSLFQRIPDQKLIS
jgi:diguanylate cyclase (GGDEF)-like protein